jgi:Ca2+-binding RTX toxin-like protein
MRKHLGIGIVVVAVGLVGAEARARASSCSFDSVSGTVTVTMDGVTAALTIAAGKIRLGTTQCGTATLTNTDSIVVNGTGTFTMRGDFVPGRTAEPSGASEIEVTIHDPKSTVDAHLGDDIITITAAGADMNSDGDVDVTWPGTATPKFKGGAGNDIVDASAYTTPIYLYGGDGDDEVIGGSGNDYLWGDAGVDVVEGNAGNDQLYGGLGDDSITGGDGNDTFREDAVANGADFMDGGLGADTLNYGSRTAGVSANLADGIGNEGAAGELDDPVAVENVTGGAGVDVLVGDALANTLRGGGGDDNLAGGGGNDKLYGDDGTDSLDGQAGSDKLYGGAGNDQLVGDAVGKDAFYGQDGDDQIVGNDDTKAEIVDCGAGTDVAEASALDTFTACETLTP